MAGSRHESTPDLSNLVKALEDACYEDDSAISEYAGQLKLWGVVGSIVIISPVPAVQDLGTANAWKETPLIVIRCRKNCFAAKHREIGRFWHEARCDDCGYVYKYDSS